MSDFALESQERMFYAGQLVSPGTYQQLETHRIIQLDKTDYLPGSLDGRVATYALISSYWTPSLQSSVQNSAA